MSETNIFDPQERAEQNVLDSNVPTPRDSQPVYDEEVGRADKMNRPEQIIKVSGK